MFPKGSVTPFGIEKLNINYFLDFVSLNKGPKSFSCLFKVYCQ